MELLYQKTTLLAIYFFGSFFWKLSFQKLKKICSVTKADDSNTRPGRLYSTKKSPSWRLVGYHSNKQLLLLDDVIYPEFIEGEPVLCKKRGTHHAIAMNAF